MKGMFGIEEQMFTPFQGLDYPISSFGRCHKAIAGALSGRITHNNREIVIPFGLKGPQNQKGTPPLVIKSLNISPEWAQAYSFFPMGLHQEMKIC